MSSLKTSSLWNVLDCGKLMLCIGYLVIIEYTYNVLELCCTGIEGSASMNKLYGTHYLANT